MARRATKKEHKKNTDKNKISNDSNHGSSGGNNNAGLRGHHTAVFRYSLHFSPTQRNARHHARRNQKAVVLLRGGGPSCH
jgi:hypothetical protein